MQLDHLILPVNDVERAVQFYTDILGLTAEAHAASAHRCTFSTRAST